VTEANGREIGITLDISFQGNSVFDLSFETDIDFGETHGINPDSCVFVFKYNFKTGELLEWSPKEMDKLEGTKIPYEDQESEMVSEHYLYTGGQSIMGGYSSGELVFYRHGEDVEDVSETDSDTAEQISELLTPEFYFKIAKAVLDELR